MFQKYKHCNDIGMPHAFEARYQEDITEEFDPTFGTKIKSTIKRTYLFDVCLSCGKIKERDQK